MLSWSQIRYGMQLGFEGGLLAVSEPKIRRWFVRTSAILVVTMLILQFLAQLLIHGPLAFLRALNWLTSSFAPYDAQRVHRTLLDARGSIDWALQTMPLTGVLLVRSVYAQPFDDMFMTVIRTHAPAYYTALVQWPHKTQWWPLVQHHVQRTWKRVKLAALMLVLLNIPVVGPYVPTLVNFKLMSGILGPNLAGAVALTAVFMPGTRGLSWTLFKAILACQQLNRELLDPYFTRLCIPPKARRAWFKERQSLLLGFVMGFYLLIRLPIIGPAFFVVAQAAMGYWIVHTTSLDSLERKPSPPRRKLS
ncbi:hypothetical protein H4R33_004583 [Dimargaris cristalligena]|uniref:Etoposide-induced protein 2.4-domain-containing protein n=1 Tax=Dimargaris cristalligena TaxID=215637 RepID=A0A4P9ZXD6_9FUNG|nr:hypothetical protein H4R33_004583 [Dimargaris cristalligena]RKP37370.1 hypothetical protein BJ085DRAFT_38407 [Dimargaris cristalligena]|eukprot:RKP37370.1 hypothetical protein BJ085DRAFT_38407 [Dimargaris cristalligena]